MLLVEERLLIDEFSRESVVLQRRARRETDRARGS
jgi:hypothetical protein